MRLCPLKVKVERSFREKNGVEMIYTALVKVGFCDLKRALKSCMYQIGMWAVRIWQNRLPTVWTNQKQKLGKRNLRWCFLQLPRDLPSDFVPLLSERVTLCTQFSFRDLISLLSQAGTNLSQKSRNSQVCVMQIVLENIIRKDVGRWHTLLTASPPGLNLLATAPLNIITATIPKGGLGQTLFLFGF